ncbi:Uncharacterised protein [Mycobacterium tuberculosis]|nr:Uncharacterised protein [Mycobacterium tuberculosis]
MPVRHMRSHRHIGRNLDERHHRDPACLGKDVVAPLLPQPVRLPKQQAGSPPGDRIRGMLQIHHPRSAPRRIRALQVACAGHETHVAAVVVDGQPLR